MSAAHKLIAETAKEMAAAMYEELAKANADWYRKHPSQKQFVRKHWPNYMESARHTLARLLTTGIAESLKEQISDALIKDNTLRRYRKGHVQWH